MIKKVFNKLGIRRFYSRSYNGKTFKIPIFDKLGFANFVQTEPWMDKILGALGSNETRILDIGVNIGQTLLKWKSQFPDSHYLGIEPNVACVHYVNTLIEKNNIKNATVLPIGFSDKTQLNYLFTSHTDPSDITATTVENFRPDGGTKALPIVSTSFDLVKDYTFDIIKIDVEGAESDVIASIFLHPPQNHPVIICEILPVYNAQNTSRIERQDKIAQILSANDYLFFRIRSKGNAIELEALDSFGIHGDMSLCEYLFVHKDETAKIEAHFKS